MKFDSGIGKKYKLSIEQAFETILDLGNDHHREPLADPIGRASDYSPWAIALREYLMTIALHAGKPAASPG